MNVALRTVSEHTMRPVWEGDDGALRIGHSGDVVTMLDDLGHPTQGSVRPANCCRPGEHAPELRAALLKATARARRRQFDTASTKSFERTVPRDWSCE